MALRHNLLFTSSDVTLPSVRLNNTITLSPLPFLHQPPDGCLEVLKVGLGRIGYLRSPESGRGVCIEHLFGVIKVSKVGACLDELKSKIKVNVVDES